MTIVRSTVFQVLFFSWTALMCVALLPAISVPRSAAVGLIRFWSRSVLWLLARVVGLTYEVRGRDHIASASTVYAFKHQSAWETIALFLLLDDPAVVLKKELLAIPLVGWYLRRLNMIAIKRDAHATALRHMIESARREFAHDRPIVVFPEGTRTPPGARRTYHPGIAALYRELEVPVVPVALNSGLFWQRRALIKRPGRITIEFLPVIPVGLSRQAFMSTLEERIEAATAALVHEAVNRFSVTKRVAV